MIIAALLEKTCANELEKLRAQFYGMGFKGPDKAIPTWELHTTLNRVEQETPHEVLSEINSKMKNITDATETIMVDDFELVNEKKADTSWIAITVNSPALLSLSKAFEVVLDEFKVNLTAEYKTNIAELKASEGNTNINRDSCIADHINLIHNCYIEYADTAYNAFSKNMPDKLVYDRIVIGENGRYFHVLPLV